MDQLVVADVIERYEADLTHRTSALYARIHALRVRAIFKGLKASSITDVSEDRLITLLGEMNIKPRTRQQYVIALKHFGKWLVGWNLMKSNPFSPFRVPHVDLLRPSEDTYLTVTEARQLMDHLATAVDRHPHSSGLTPLGRRLLYATAIRAGLRPSEILNLRSTDLHLDGPTAFITVRSQKSRGSDDLPIPKELASALRRHVTRLPSGDHVFRPVSVTVLRLIFRRDLQGAGIIWRNATRHLAFHNLRRTAIHWWLTEYKLPLDHVQMLARLRATPFFHSHGRSIVFNNLDWLDNPPKLLDPES